MFERFLSKILKSPALVGILVLFLFAAGIISYRGLNVDLFPPLDFPVLNIIAEAPGFSSLEMERQVTLPIESAASGVLGVIRVRSVMATGISMISAEFQWGTDMITARQLILAALTQTAGQLPPEVEPSVENLSATLALIEGYSLQGGDDLIKLRDIANYELKPRLQGILGVYKVVVAGGKIREYAVYPNPFLMMKYNLALSDLKHALANNNILVSPGVVNNYSQEFVVRANGQFKNPEDIKNVVVAIKSGIPIKIEDIARVIDAYQFQRQDASEKGRPSVLINIYKQPRFDTIKVAHAIAQKIAEFQRTLPRGFTIHNYYDQSELVSDSIGSVKESVVIGAVLVVLVLLAFLRNLRLTLVATLSIPISVIAAIVLMRLFGVGLNIMSLGGLAVGSGIIVDDAIVVIENIFRHLSQFRANSLENLLKIIVEAVSEVVRPVIVSTLTNIGIFAPMVFVAGLAGSLFKPVALTVTFALLASLVVALTVIPVLVLKLAAQSRIQEKSEGVFEKYYLHFLNLSLNYPLKTILLVGLIPFLISWTAFKRLNTEFLPALDESAIQLQTTLPPGASLSESRKVNSAIEHWIKKIPGVITVVRNTGHAPGTLDVDSVNRSDINVKLVPKTRRPISINDLIAALSEKTSKLPGVNVEYLMPLADKINDAMGGIPYDIGIDFFGPSLTTLGKLTADLTTRIKSIPGVADIKPPENIPLPSLKASINRKEAGRLGISERSIFDLLQAYSVGLTATSVRRLFKSIGVVLHFTKPGQNIDLEALKSLPLKTAGGNIVPLEQVANFNYAETPSKIYHEHLSRKMTVAFNVRGRNVNDVAKDVEKQIAAMNLPKGYSWSYSGKYASGQSAMMNMEAVFLMAIFVVAIILWMEFKSLVQVGLILLTLPLAAVGAALSLWLFKESLNVSSMIGAVMLIGIVVRNGIILLDYMNSGLAKGQSLKEALRAAALKRARPILMTASVAILGLVPIATGWGTGSELLQPLAIAVIGGLLTSTILTLIVLPAAAVVAIKNP